MTQLLLESQSRNDVTSKFQITFNKTHFHILFVSRKHATEMLQQNCFKTSRAFEINAIYQECLKYALIYYLMFRINTPIQTSVL